MPTFTKIDQMTVGIYESNAAVGDAAAADFAKIVKQAVFERGETSVIFASGNSQLAFLQALQRHTDIPWDKISAFHMDEYLGMSAEHPASFRRFLREKVANIFQPRMAFGMRGDARDVQAELDRYAALLEKHQPVLCVMGMGENGHLAFNDPPADFMTDKLIHIVTLDMACRRQQVGEGHFPTIDDVPTQAISLTIHALLQPPQVMVLVPESRKAKAVKDALEGPITEMCPASILRAQENVKMYLDGDSSALLNR
jgi:glucosamine-6-phosphate deaminase